MLASRGQICSLTATGQPGVGAGAWSTSRCDAPAPASATPTIQGEQSTRHHVITPRRTRLLRTADLQGFQRAILGVVQELATDAHRLRHTAVLVPTAAAAVALRRSVADLGGPCLRAAAAVSLSTRDAWYRQMHRDHGGLPDLLSGVEREACMFAAARIAHTQAEPPFRLRSGLVPAIVSFYDELRRHRRSVDAFDRLVTDDLEPSVDLDRGARRLLRQTRFLVTTFQEYDRRLAALARLDEHGLRTRLLDDPSSAPLERVIVTIPDYVVDSTGLWPADYDLLTRLPGLEAIDVVTTDRVLDAGFYERVVESLPGIEEVRAPTPTTRVPVVVTPPGGTPRHFVCRDREEELRAVIRYVTNRSGERRVGVVYRRPLPYLYLARELFTQAGLACHSLDGFPLAAEPYAAAVDLVCRFVTSQFDRVSIIALLRSPHFAFSVADAGRLPESVESLDHALSQARFLGGRAALQQLVTVWEDHDQTHDGVARPLRGLRVARDLAQELVTLETPTATSHHLEVLAAFLRRHECHQSPPKEMVEREAAAKQLVWESIDELAGASRDVDDENRSFDETVALLRRTIEGRTLHTPGDDSGIQLLDPHAAAYRVFDELFVVGLVEGEWPEHAAHNVFYPSSLLRPLGWPKERDVARAAQASFIDLLSLPVASVVVSTISLENDTVVSPSTLLEELDEVELPSVVSEVDDTLCVTPDDALALDMVRPGVLSPEATVWLEHRSLREPVPASARGQVGPRRPARYAVSALDVYLDCPFKYFAQRVLKLGEEPVDERTATPRRLGQVLHAVFESFYKTWQNERSDPEVTIDMLTVAIDRFRELTELALDTLPSADRVVVRSWLLGSAAAAGLAERLLTLETAQRRHLARRFTELRIDGEFILGGEHGPRSVHLRGVADRVDLFSDGTFRVVDYKTNRAPDRNRSVQLPVYARCLEASLDDGTRQKPRAVEASYAAFGEPRVHVALGRRSFDDDVRAGERRAVDVVDRIERGEFPVRPAELYRCNFCPYPTVCRKDYVGDE